MFKLIKYEIIGKYKALIILSIITIILNLALLSRWNSWNHSAIISLSVMILVVVSVVVFIWCIGIFSQDVYDDKGYLTFTIPQSGYSILGSKLIVSCIFSVITSIVSGIFIYGFISNNVDISKQLDTVGLRINVITCIIFVLWSIFDFALVLLEIYFAITITRLAVFKKRLGKFIAFVAYIIEVVILSVINWGLAKIFPQKCYIKMFEGVSGSISSNGRASIDVITKGLPYNIATSIVFPIILVVALFMATSYMIEKKIDL
jgi:ABC-2 type transport system permease protein